jgi:glucose/arabinose dehydrogenase
LESLTSSRFRWDEVLSPLKSSPYLRNRGTRQAGFSLIRVFVGVCVGMLMAAGSAAVWASVDGPGARRALVLLMTPSYEVAAGPATADPKVKQDVRVALTEIASGFAQPTDIQFPPGNTEQALVLEKPGVARWLKLKTGVHGRLLGVHALTASEEGLLGAAFHPDYANNGRVFLNYVTEVAGKHKSRVEEWRFDPPGDLVEAKARVVRTVLEQDQPYQNHNAGCLVFGPDGYLYIGFGDGGFADDPHRHGQNPKTWLGSMLRIDVNIDFEAKHGRKAAARPYRVPPDNPFVGRDGFAPETYAFGLRNPWRYSFDPKGRLIVADVGQNHWEEIDIVARGDNLGWNVREGFACLDSDETDCPRESAIDPIHVYGRDLGTSITGGHVYLGARIPTLRGRYVFGDFTSGRLWAITLPEDRTKRVDAAVSLGRFPVFVSSFGRDHAGELYITSFADGRILRIDPAKPSSAK